MPEVNFKKDFCEKYFDSGVWQLDLNTVDVILTDKRGNYLLYIESKYIISDENDHRRALAQVILTNKKQKDILSEVALIYKDKEDNDILELIDCSENSVMYNNDINWKAERPSNPTKDAIDRINDRIKGKVTRYINDEISEMYSALKKGNNTKIDITDKNFNVVYNAWKRDVTFREEIKNEQELINLFLVDILNGTMYKKSILQDIDDHSLFTTDKTKPSDEDTEQDLIREGTNLNCYKLESFSDGRKIITYESKKQLHGKSFFYTFSDKDKYDFFWNKYNRPPAKEEFLKILEHSHTLYSEQYRKDTGGEYTPFFFVEKQNEILRQHYDLDEYIVFDPCCGVGNLENLFGKDYKQYVYLSTLEQMDVDICKIKDFENSIQFDYLKDNTQPKFKYKGSLLDINEICKREKRKLMVIMNPPYVRQKGFNQNNLAIEFFNKVLALQPQVIVFYYMTSIFFRSEIEQYKKSNYKIVSHIFSNAKTTFRLSEWPISQIIFDRENGDEITDYITADRYEYNKKEGKLNFIKTYTYDNKRPNLIKEIEKEIKDNQSGLTLGQWTNQSYCIVISNRLSHTQYITTQNLQYALLLKGINFNTHAKYFETSDLTYKGKIEDISEELFNDAIMFSQFYIGNAFTNKGQKNYIMPFTSEELGCEKNDLNVLFPQDANVDLFSENIEKPFDFREFFHSFKYSKQAKKLYSAALKVFKYYHSQDCYKNKDFNDSFYDITNAIMGKDPENFQDLQTDNDTRITKVKTTKGTRGFGRNTIKYAVNSEYLPIFEEFFDARDTLARKINKELVDQGLLLWERENIY
jgi:hypothetical protein